MKTDNLAIEIKCNGVDKTSEALSKASFKLFLMRIGITEKETQDEKLRRKRKLEMIREYKQSIIERNQRIRKLRNTKGVKEFQKVYEELTRK